MSILYVFSNDMQHTCRTRLIDFAHVMNSGGDLDHNVINALENLLQIWEKSLTVDY